MDLHLQRSWAFVAGRTRATRWLSALLIALLAPVLLLTPSGASAVSTSMVAACAGVNTRTSPSTASPVKAQLAAAATLTIAGTVSGSPWRATCPTVKSGSTWYRISAINGKSVKHLYGVTYLYAAAGVLKAAPGS